MPETGGGFERWSTDHSQLCDWEPWILYVALVWRLVVAIVALKVHFDRPTTEAEVDREVRRLRSSTVRLDEVMSSIVTRTFRKANSR